MTSARFFCEAPTGTEVAAATCHARGWITRAQLEHICGSAERADAALAQLNGETT